MSNSNVPARYGKQVTVVDESNMSLQELRREQHRRKQNKRQTATLTDVGDLQKRRLGEIANATSQVR